MTVKFEIEGTIAVTKAKLNFSPDTWAQLTYMCKAASTEIGCFAITTPENNLYVEELWFPEQKCTAATVEFDDASMADMLEDLSEKFPPEECFRIWIHTHPGSSAAPSGTDEDTFKNILGNFDWSVMAILAKGGQTYARLQHKAPFNLEDEKIQCPLEMGVWSDGYQEWDTILETQVKKPTVYPTGKAYYGGVSGNYNSGLWDPYAYDDDNYYKIGSKNAKPK